MSTEQPSLTSEQIEYLRALLRQRQEEVKQALTASTEAARPVGLDLAIGRLTCVDALQQQNMATARKDSMDLTHGPSGYEGDNAVRYVRYLRDSFGFRVALR